MKIYKQKTTDEYQKLNEFDTEFKNLTKKFNEAKDNVKFLTILERQFKGIASGDFQSIEEIIPSLFIALNSGVTAPYYKKGDNFTELLMTIADEIGDKVEAKIRIDKLLQPRGELNEYDKQLKEAMQDIKHGYQIMDSWIVNFTAGRKKADEESTNERWDIVPKLITERIEHMKVVSDNLLRICEILQNFLQFLGNSLRSVTGDTAGIDELRKEVLGLVGPLVTFNYNVTHFLYNKLFNNHYL